MAPPRHFCAIEPRRGSRPDECEDAAACDPARGRFAVADGAGESSNAGLWARLLVETFVKEEAQPWPAWIPPLQARWAQAVAPADEAQPWFLDGRVEQGAFSTFLGLCVGEEAWHAVAVGDSCLFHVSGDELSTALPLTSPTQFGNAPVLIGSRQPVDGVPLRRAIQGMGACRAGDRFWLMTDALARWFLERAERGEKPWRLLEQRLCGKPRGEFAGWVAGLRSSRELRDDDAAIVGVLL